jgi:transposase InsO family protein
MAIAEYDSEEQARRAVREYVNYYRFDRKHSSLGYLTPTQFTRRAMLETVS